MGFPAIVIRKFIVGPKLPHLFDDVRHLRTTLGIHMAFQTCSHFALISVKIKIKGGLIFKIIIINGGAFS